MHNLAPSKACLILAAGSSSRFGGAKLQHELPSGQPLLLQTCSRYQQVFDSITVVINAADTELLQMLQSAHIRAVLCGTAAAGMSHSLIAGLRSQLHSSATLVALGDMPYISSESIKKIHAAMSPTRIIVPLHAGQQGNPVAFGQRFYAQLLALAGDVGAKQVIANNPKNVTEIAMDDFGLMHDIDTPDQILPSLE